MKRFNRVRYRLLALVLLMTLTFTWATTRKTHRPYVTKANSEKIKKGMSPDEVEGILGGSVRRPPSRPVCPDERG
jgi:hypothetical protein